MSGSIPWYYRLGKTFWHASVERMPAIMSSSEVFDSERMTSLVRDYLKDRVAEGHCVVVGRGAASALVNVPGTFHVFVYASTARKLAWFRDQFPGRAENAQQELEATDAGAPATSAASTTRSGTITGSISSC